MKHILEWKIATFTVALGGLQLLGYTHATAKPHLTGCDPVAGQRVVCTDSGSASATAKARPLSRLRYQWEDEAEEATDHKARQSLKALTSVPHLPPSVEPLR